MASYFLKLLFLSGKYLTNVAITSILQATTKSTEFKSRIVKQIEDVSSNVKYEKNMFEAINDSRIAPLPEQEKSINNNNFKNAKTQTKVDDLPIASASTLQRTLLNKASTVQLYSTPVASATKLQLPKSSDESEIKAPLISTVSRNNLHVLNHCGSAKQCEGVDWSEIAELLVQNTKLTNLFNKNEDLNNDIRRDNLLNLFKYLSNLDSFYRKELKSLLSNSKNEILNNEMLHCYEINTLRKLQTITENCLNKVGKTINKPNMKNNFCDSIQNEIFNCIIGSLQVERNTRFRIQFSLCHSIFPHKPHPYLLLNRGYGGKNGDLDTEINEAEKLVEVNSTAFKKLERKILLNTLGISHRPLDDHVKSSDLPQTRHKSHYSHFTTDKLIKAKDGVDDISVELPNNVDIYYSSHTKTNREFTPIASILETHYRTVEIDKDLDDQDQDQEIKKMITYNKNNNAISIQLQKLIGTSPDNPVEGLHLNTNIVNFAKEPADTSYLTPETISKYSPLTTTGNINTRPIIPKTLSGGSDKPNQTLDDPKSPVNNPKMEEEFNEYLEAFETNYTFMHTNANLRTPNSTAADLAEQDDTLFDIYNSLKPSGIKDSTKSNDRLGVEEEFPSSYNCTEYDYDLTKPSDEDSAAARDNYEDLTPYGSSDYDVDLTRTDDLHDNLKEPGISPHPYGYRFSSDGIAPSLPESSMPARISEYDADLTDPDNFIDDDHTDFIETIQSFPFARDTAEGMRMTAADYDFDLTNPDGLHDISPDNTPPSDMADTDDVFSKYDITDPNNFIDNDGIADEMEQIQYTSGNISDYKQDGVLQSDTPLNAMGPDNVVKNYMPAFPSGIIQLVSDNITGTTDTPEIDGIFVPYASTDYDYDLTRPDNINEGYYTNFIPELQPNDLFSEFDLTDPANTIDNDAIADQLEQMKFTYDYGSYAPYGSSDYDFDLTSPSTFNINNLNDRTIDLTHPFSYIPELDESDEFSESDLTDPKNARESSLYSIKPTKFTAGQPAAMPLAKAYDDSIQILQDITTQSTLKRWVEVDTISDMKLFPVKRRETQHPTAINHTISGTTLRSLNMASKKRIPKEHSQDMHQHVGTTWPKSTNNEPRHCGYLNRSTSKIQSNTKPFCSCPTNRSVKRNNSTKSNAIDLSKQQPLNISNHTSKLYQQRQFIKKTNIGAHVVSSKINGTTKGVLPNVVLKPELLNETKKLPKITGTSKASTTESTVKEKSLNTPRIPEKIHALLSGKKNTKVNVASTRCNQHFSRNSKLNQDTQISYLHKIPTTAKVHTELGSKGSSIVCLPASITAVNGNNSEKLDATKLKELVSKDVTIFPKIKSTCSNSLKNNTLIVQKPQTIGVAPNSIAEGKEKAVKQCAMKDIPPKPKSSLVQKTTELKSLLFTSATLQKGRFFFKKIMNNRNTHSTNDEKLTVKSEVVGTDDISALLHENIEHRTSADQFVALDLMSAEDPLVKLAATEGFDDDEEDDDEDEWSPYDEKLDREQVMEINQKVFDSLEDTMKIVALLDPAKTNRRDISKREETSTVNQINCKGVKPFRNDLGRKKHRLFVVTRCFSKHKSDNSESEMDDSESETDSNQSKPENNIEQKLKSILLHYYDVNGEKSTWDRKVEICQNVNDKFDRILHTLSIDANATDIREQLLNDELTKSLAEYEQGLDLLNDASTQQTQAERVNRNNVVKHFNEKVKGMAMKCASNQSLHERNGFIYQPPSSRSSSMFCSCSMCTQAAQSHPDTKEQLLFKQLYHMIHNYRENRQYSWNNSEINLLTNWSEIIRCNGTTKNAITSKNVQDLNSSAEKKDKVESSVISIRNEEPIEEMRETQSSYSLACPLDINDCTCILYSHGDDALALYATKTPETGQETGQESIFGRIRGALANIGALLGPAAAGKEEMDPKTFGIQAKTPPAFTEAEEATGEDKVDKDNEHIDDEAAFRPTETEEGTSLDSAEQRHKD